MHRTDAPPPHATHRCGLFEAAFAETRATMALIQIRNGLKALRRDVPSPVSPELVLQNIEANLQIVEQALAQAMAETLGVRP